MSELQPRRGTITETITDLDYDLETGEPLAAHIVKTEPGESAAAQVLEARIHGTALEAGLGSVWVASGDPERLALAGGTRFCPWTGSAVPARRGPRAPAGFSSPSQRRRTVSRNFPFHSRQGWGKFPTW